MAGKLNPPNKYKENNPPSFPTMKQEMTFIVISILIIAGLIVGLSYLI